MTTSPTGISNPLTGRPSQRLLRHRSAFTLLELVLVMLLICIAMAVAAPNLRGFRSGAELKNAASQLVAITGYARTQSVAEARLYRLNVDGDSYSLTVQDDDGAFNPPSNDMGQTFSLPDSLQLQLTRDDGNTPDHVDFFPDGRTEPARFRLSRRLDGSDLYVDCFSPAERFHIATSSEIQAETANH